MEKRSIDTILEETLPEKSKDSYIKHWESFRRTLDHSDEPTEENYIQYFDFLRKKENKAASTLWKIYSMLNYMHQHEYNRKLQILSPKLTLLLKSYNSCYTRKVASIFTKEQVQAFLSMEELDDNPFWIIRKAMAVVAIAGGLRCAELTDLKFEDFENREDTFHFNITRKKQVGEQLHSSFVIPSSRYIYLHNYIVALKSKFGNEICQGRLWKGTPKYSNTDNFRFIQQPMGINKISAVGTDIAKILKLDNPETYTGHCFRRTAATFAADGGATTSAMKRHFGWKSENTAMKYINHSESGAIAMADIINPCSSSDNNLTVMKSTNLSSQHEVSTVKKVYHINCDGSNNTYNFY